MQKHTLVLCIAISFAAVAKPKSEPAANASKDKMVYPKTRVQSVSELLHGVTVADPYRWLEDVGSNEVQRWMADQDHLAREYLHKLPGRDALTARLKALYYVESISAPRHRGKYLFYMRTHADREKAIVYVREGENGAERVLLDPNTMTKDGTTSLGTWVPSHDGKKVVYALRANNSDEATLHLIDVASGKVSEIDIIEGGKYADPSWTPSGDGFYYTYLPPLGGKITVAERPGFADVRFHVVGHDPKQDSVVHPATGDAETFITADISRDGHWLFTYVQHGWNSTDVYFRDMRSKGGIL